MYGFTESDSPEFRAAAGEPLLKRKRRGFWNWKSLAVLSGLLAVAPALVYMLANLYWLNAPLAEGLEYNRPTNIFEGVPMALILGVVAEAIYFGLFFYPTLRLGRWAIGMYFILNGLGAAWVASIYWSLADPSNVGGWVSLAIPTVILAPIVLGISLLVIAAVRWSKSQKVRQGNVFPEARS